MHMIRNLVNFFKTGSDRPLVSSNPAVIRDMYEAKRWSVFITVTIAYGFYYLCRLSFAVTKKPMLDEGVLTATELGMIGSAMLIVYSVSKLVNGFLGDRSNVKRFFSAGLLVSALINLVLGFNSMFFVFLVLWGLNGWFQGMGGAPSVVTLSHWFSNSERGTRYGIWSTGHFIGEGITFFGTALLVHHSGWRWGFWGQALLCIAAASVAYRFLADRPETYGLPPVSVYKNDHVPPAPHDSSVTRAQLHVVRNPAVWVLGLSSAFMYCSRYGVNSWAILYLQEAKNYSLVEAGSIISVNSVMGVFGAVLSGFVSDRLFRSQRNWPTLIFGMLVSISLASFYLVPAGHKMVDMISMAVFGLAMGAVLCYLGGLTAVDISSRHAAGAAMGMIGLFSYIGAGIQDTVSGLLIDAGRTVSGGHVRHDFSAAIWFWIGASVVSMILALFVWNAKSAEPSENTDPDGADQLPEPADI
ncbi:MAG TPA: MFS transporter [Spirochaetota bacterium]|nr:MFS transporter [Spirochaetota bacterium]